MQRPTEAHLLYQPRAACPPVPTEASSWAQILGRYRKPSHARSIIEIAITFSPLSALWALAWTALYLGYWWLCLLLAMPAAGFLVRQFMIQHDCGHGSYREARLALEILEASAGLLYETKAPRVGRGFQGIAIMRDGALIDSETKAVNARFQQQSTRSVNQTLTCGFASGHSSSTALGVRPGAPRLEPRARRYLKGER